LRVVFLITLGYLREAIERTFGQFVDDIDAFSLGNLVGVITRKDDVQDFNLSSYLILL